jgi:hypothetical protein
MKLNTNYDLAEVYARMCEENPQGYKKSIKQVLDNYFVKVPQYLCRGVDLLREQQVGIPFPRRKIRSDLLGRYGPGQKKYWLDWFEQHYPLYEILKRGYKHKGQKYGELTMVKPLAFTQEQLEQIESSLTDQEFWDIHYDIQDPSDVTVWDNYYFTAIDTRSLQAFIDDNESLQSTEKNTALLAKLQANHKAAVRIQRASQIAQAFWSLPFALLPQRISESQFGRQYLSGINLQTVSKQVRHAALGKCKEYDLENSVFAWKYDMAKQLEPTMKFPATLEYLDRKDAVRNQVTMSVFGNKKDYGTIKAAITAISFGARKSNGSWLDANGTWKSSSLREIIYSPEKLNLFLTNPWVAELVNEQSLMTKIIFDHHKETTLIENNRELLSEGGLLKQNKVVSFLYQTAERDIMNTLMSVAKNAKCLLLCHDAFYTKSDAPLLSMREALQEHNEYAKINEVGHRAWAFNDVKQHEDWIRDEEIRANEHFLSQGLPGWSQERILKKASWAKQRQQRVMNENYSMENGREFDNGSRIESRYDPEFDPFYMDDEY